MRFEKRLGIYCKKPEQKTNKILKVKRQPWPVWLSWLEHHPVDQKVTGLIPSQGTYLGCRFDPQSGPTQEGNQSMFLSHVAIYLSPFLSLKAMKKCPRVRIEKKQNFF